jgi:hypothetical protein
MGTSVPERVLTWESRDGGEVIAAERHIGNPGRTVLSTPWGLLDRRARTDWPQLTGKKGGPLWGTDEAGLAGLGHGQVCRGVSTS